MLSTDALFTPVGSTYTVEPISSLAQVLNTSQN